MTLTAARAPRADAERNRRRVLDAATEVFAERGMSATLNDVARAAGVGVGTVYRNFADKEEMLDELFTAKIDALVGLVDTTSTEHDPGVAFRGFLLRLMDARANDRGLDAILSTPGRSARFSDELGRRFMPEVDRLVSRAISAGELREGFAGQEVCLLAFMVGKVADITLAGDPEVWRRYAQLLIDGTRLSPGTEPLTPAALGFADMTAALGRSN